MEKTGNENMRTVQPVFGSVSVSIVFTFEYVNVYAVQDQVGPSGPAWSCHGRVCHGLVTHQGRAAYVRGLQEEHICMGAK
jgi:hypothetical protein